MDKILFLEGLKANLPFSNPTVGAIYFTTDTHELYFGLSDTELVPLDSTLLKTYVDNAEDTAEAYTDSALASLKYAGSSSVGGAATSANKLATARTIALSGAVTGTATSFNGSANITIPTTAVDPTKISAGAIANRVYYSHHPESGTGILPFIYNDLGFLLSKGGSMSAYITSSTDYTVASLTSTSTVSGANSSMFDGTPSYAYMSISDKASVMVIDLTLHKTFQYGTVFYIDFGSTSWRAQDISVYVMNSNYDTVYTKKTSTTGLSRPVYFDNISYSTTNSSGSTVQGFNKLRIVLTNFYSTTPRIAEIGLINYGSSGTSETLLSKGGGSVYGSVYPYSNNATTLGTSSNKWSNVYATTFTGALSGNATTATTANKLSTSAGSTTQPVYFQDGIPTACDYSLEASVPSDAVFTDTPGYFLTTFTQSVSGTWTASATKAQQIEAYNNGQVLLAYINTLDYTCICQCCEKLSSSTLAYRGFYRPTLTSTVMNPISITYSAGSDNFTINTSLGENYIVNYTKQEDGSYVADRSYYDIINAVSSHTVIAVVDGIYLPLVAYDSAVKSVQYSLAYLNGNEISQISLEHNSSQAIEYTEEDCIIPEAYTLPAATSSTLGGVKIGSNITNSSGTISLTKSNVTSALGYTPPTINTTYSAGTGLSLSGTTFNHSNSITAGSVQGGSGTLGFGGTITVPKITYDAQGHITGATTTSYTLPANPNSDTKVTNTLATTTKAYVTGTTSATTNTGTQIFDTGVYLDTTAGQLTATTFKGALSGNATTATTLATARTIDGVSFNGSTAIIHYGSCSTAAATAAKTVSCTGFTLVTGAVIRVKFTVTNTASSPTLNVNSTGAKSIYYRGSAITADYLAANRTYEFVYNGTQYELVGDINTDTTYSAGTGISLSGTIFSNAGVRSIVSGSTNGTIRVNTGGTNAEVAVKGLGSFAYLSSLALTDDKLTGVLTVDNGGTGISSNPSMLVNLASTTAASVFATSPRPGVTGTLPVTNGGTGQTSGINAANYFLNCLGTGSSTPVDADYYISQYANGGTTTTTYHRRPMRALWSYIKGKADSTYVNTTGDTMTGELIVNANVNAQTVEVNSGVTLEYDSTNKCLNFVFN